MPDWTIFLESGAYGEILRPNKFCTPGTRRLILLPCYVLFSVCLWFWLCFHLEIILVVIQELKLTKTLFRYVYVTVTFMQCLNGLAFPRHLWSESLGSNATYPSTLFNSVLIPLFFTSARPRESSVYSIYQTEIVTCARPERQARSFRDLFGYIWKPRW